MPHRSSLAPGACLSLLLAIVATAPSQPAADSPVSLDDMVRAVQATAGVCVHLGSGDGTLSARFAESGRLLVHALEADPARVASARKTWQARGIYGAVSIEQWTASSLPYADNLVNVLVAENPGPVPESEMTRVLVPGGVLWRRQAAGWSMIRKPWSSDYDEWTHWRHGADGNMVSRDLAVDVPKGLRWVAGPPQDAGGRRWYYDHVLVSARGRNFYVYENEIVARDAFNGSWLWTRPMKAYTFRETGTAVPEFLLPKAKLGVRMSKVRPVAMSDRLYVAAEGRLLALDAATGREVVEFGRVSSPREVLVSSNTLVVSDARGIRAWDIPSRRVAWEIAIDAERIVAGDGVLFCLSSNLIAAADLATGVERWRTLDAQAVPATTCTYSQGVLVLEKSSWRDDPIGCGTLVYSGQNGRLLWKREHRTDMTHWQETRTFFARGLLWLQTEGGQVTGFDPFTGKQIKTWKAHGEHCATPVATERFFIAPECEFTDLASGLKTRAQMFKSACRLPFIPANGLLYSFPVQCECFPMLRGYMGLAPDRTPESVAEARLQRGPAFGREPALRGGGDPAAEWPMYRHNLLRSGSTPAPLRVGELKPVWTASVAQAPRGALAAEWAFNPYVRGVLTPPVVAGDLLVVAVPDDHRVVALNARTGQARWSFTAGGRIDTPPTLAEGLCLFGSHDGWVYCLNAADGELAWKFHGAPGDTRIMAYGQVESLWPVPGSVLVDQGTVYFTAGRHPMSDGGVRMFALKARTGEIVWQKTLNEIVLPGWYGWQLPSKKTVGVDFEPVDLLVKEGKTLSMSRWQIDPDRGDSRLVFSNVTYQVGGVEVPRGLWGYGIRQTKMVQPKPPAVFDSAKIHTGTTNDAALLVAGGTLIIGGTDGRLTVGDRSVSLETPPVHDGLAVAYGRLYVAGQNGRVVCLE